MNEEDDKESFKFVVCFNDRSVCLYPHCGCTEAGRNSGRNGRDGRRSNGACGI